MPVDFIPAMQVAANVEAQSGWRVIQTRVALASCRLTASGNAWPNAIDNTRHIKCYGLQIDAEDGPRWWLYEGDPWDSIYLPDGVSTKDDLGGPHEDWWLPFGLRGKDGTMPRILVSGSIPVRARLRLAILADAPITLGAEFNYT